MSDVYFFKVVNTWPDDEKIKIIKKMPEGDALIVIWFELMSMASRLNCDGWVYIGEGLPYCDETLATVLGRTAMVTRLAIDTFSQLRMIEVTDRGIFLINFSKHQSIEKLAKIREDGRIRQANLRARHKMLHQGSSNGNSNDVVTLRNEQEKDIRIRIREEIENVTLRNNDDAKNYWEKAKDELKSQINKSNYRTWIEKTEGLFCEDGIFAVGTPNKYTSDYLEKNQRSLIEKVLAGIMNNNEIKVAFTEVIDGD